MTTVPVAHEVSKPEVEGFQLTTSSEPVNASIDRQTIGELLLSSIDWDKAESRESERSGQKYKTTRSISWNMADNEERRYQITVSVNRWEAKSAREPLAKASKEQVYKLGSTEIAFLASEMDKAKGNGDFERFEKLMTLKSKNQLQGGLDLNGLIAVKEEIAAVVEAKTPPKE